MGPFVKDLGDLRRLAAEARVESPKLASERNEWREMDGHGGIEVLIYVDMI
jgi:hypothetical protein